MATLICYIFSHMEGDEMQFSLRTRDAKIFLCEDVRS